MTPRAAATEVVKTLRERGHEAWLVGGCVSDIVLGREPEDYDVTTSATPEQVMAIFPKTFAVGVQFGGVLVPFEREASEPEPANDQRPTTVANDVIEVATFRSDLGYSDGRHPDGVVF